MFLMNDYMEICMSHIKNIILFLIKIKARYLLKNKVVNALEHCILKNYNN